MAFKDIRESTPLDKERENLHISLKYSFSDEKEKQIAESIIMIGGKYGMSAKDVVDNLLEEAIPAFFADEESKEEVKPTILKPKVK